MIRAGIIGCGNIAKAHAGAYQNNTIEIKGFTDVEKAAAESLAKEIKGAVCYEDFKTMIDDGQVDVVSVCTPPDAHERAAVYALENGVSVLCEKPLAHTVESARRMVAASEGSEALLMTAYRHRFLPAIRKILKLIVTRTIGPVVFFRNSFIGPAFGMKEKWFSQRAISGGGTLMDTSSHSVDLFRYLFGEVLESKAVMHRHLEETDVEDASILILKGETGTLGVLCASWVSGEEQASLEIVGQEGRISYNYFEPEELRLRLRVDKEDRILAVDASDGFSEEIAHFARAVSGEGVLSCTGEDGLRALEIIQQEYLGQTGWKSSISANT